MRIPLVASLILGAHVAVIGSALMIQGCTTSGPGGSTISEIPPIRTEQPPPPVMPPVATPAVFPSAPIEPVVTSTLPNVPPPEVQAGAPVAGSSQNIYVVKTGDSLSKIAVRHSVNIDELAELNGIKDANKIRIGQKLMLPDYASASQSKPVEKPAAKPELSGDAYVVQSGDSLSKIAAKFGVKTKALAEANNIKDANKIRSGQKLVIPGAAKAAAAPAVTPSAPGATPAKPVSPAVETPKAPVAPAPRPVAPLPAPVKEEVIAATTAAVVSGLDVDQNSLLDYTTQDGDTAESIARLFVVRKEDILAVNNIPFGEDLKPGQKIKIPQSPY